MELKEWSIKDIVWMLVIGFVVIEVLIIFVGYFNLSFSSVVRIFLVIIILIIIV